MAERELSDRERDSASSPELPASAAPEKRPVADDVVIECPWAKGSFCKDLPGAVGVVDVTSPTVTVHAIEADAAPGASGSGSAVFRCFATLVPSGGLVANCFSLGSVTLAGGILSMPSSFAESGIASAVLQLAVNNLFAIYSMYLVGVAMQRTGARTFEQLGRVLFGRGWDYVVGCVLGVSGFGTAVAYVSAVTTLVEPVCRSLAAPGSWWRTRSAHQLLTCVVWLLFMVPVVIPRRVNAIRYVSVVGVTMVFYFVVCIVVHGAASEGMRLGARGDMVYFRTGNRGVASVSIYVFCFMAQYACCPCYWEMSPRPSVRQLTLASAIAMTTCTALYVLAGYFGYMEFGDDVRDSVLLNFDPVRQPLIMVAYLGMLVKIVAAFGINSHPIKNAATLYLGWDADTTPRWRHAALAFGLALAILLVSLCVPSINTAFGLVGSLTGTLIGFLFPGFFYMYTGNWTLRTVGPFRFFATHALNYCGVVAMVVGTAGIIYSSWFAA